MLPGISNYLIGADIVPAIRGQQLFESSTTWTVPENVTSICAVVVGGGTGTTTAPGKGGSLRWINFLEVTPGETLTITVGSANNSSRIKRGGTDLIVAAGGTEGTSSSLLIENVGGGDGGNVGNNDVGPTSTGYGGSGGAGGYSGNGGRGGDSNNSFRQGSSGTGGSGGGGGGGYRAIPSPNGLGGLGGGVGLLGEGSSGAGGGGAFSIGSSGGNGSPGSSGSGTKYGGSNRSGGIRIIWGDGRAFPNTNTGDL